jgi:outer membrane protein, protease secretion system
VQIRVNQTIYGLVVFAAFGFATQANALSLLEAYQAALANDSIYHSAQHENEAGQQYKVIGRANLLPNVSASYSFNRNNLDITTKGNGRSREETRNYNSENAAIQVRQPIINMEGWARYHQGNAQTNLSDKQFAVRKQDLITRFFGLFVNANYAEDVLALAESQRDAFKNQVEANALMSKRGEGTKTALIESQAKLSLSEAQVIESKDSLADARNALATMLDKEITEIDRLPDAPADFPAELQSYDEWKNVAIQNNPEIAAQREAVEIASYEVKRNRAGHMPRLDAVASISQSDSDSIPTFKQELDSKTIGVQLNIPIYSGGSVTAQTRQAAANHQKAQDDLESKTNEVLLDLRKQFSTTQSGLLRIDALKQSVASAELLVAATKKSLLGGVRTNLDVLDARKQLFEAKRDLSLARYNYLVAYINLRKAAGVLTVVDLEKMAALFVNQPRTIGNDDMQASNQTSTQTKPN